MSSSYWVTSAQSNNSQVFGTSFSIFKSVCWSQKKMCLSVTKYKCVCRSQNSHTRSCITCHMSHVTCQVSHIKCCMSAVTMSHVPNANSHSHRPSSCLLPNFPNRKCVYVTKYINVSVSHKIVI